jgi:GH35 family endo-1,4-beta-xylanase
MPYPRFLNPSYKAGSEVGFEYLYDMGEISWKKISPEKGHYDFSEYDLELKRVKDLGFEVVVMVPWQGDNTPAWAETLEFSEYRQQLSEFVKKVVEHLRGKVKYLNLVVEPSLSTIAGNRYIDVEFESDYIKGVKVDELIDLVQTAFQAARTVDSDMCFGYSVAPSYNYWQLNPTPFGGKPSPYSLLKLMLENGVRPDYIGVEFQSGTIQVPIDLATLSEIIQAYHALSGLPILITELSSYPSRAGDYNLTGPAPNVYWHEGMTQKVQAEWDTSVVKIAMGLPYVLGVQMVHIVQDNPEWGQSLYDGTFIGTDYLTQDYKPKLVYYAMRDLFDSWAVQGSVVSDDSGKVNFRGMNGSYSITVTTPDGLSQTFGTHLGSESKLVTVIVDRTKAVEELQTLVVEAQKGLDLFEQAGRTLDYNSLRAQLEEARSAMADGNYAKARTLAQQILDAIVIEIDGNPDDWKGIKPIATAPPGGVDINAPGTDLKALYGICDDKNLYLMVEVYDPPVSLQHGSIKGGIGYPQFLFNLKTDRDEQHHLRAYLLYGGQMDVYLLTNPAQVLATLYTVAYGKVLELKVPLASLDNPSRLSVFAFVMAIEDGNEKSVKNFQDYGQAIHP